MPRVRKLKSINYLEALKAKSSSVSISGGLAVAIVSLVFFALLIASIYVIIVLSTNNAKKSLDSINSYINDETNVALYNSAVRNQDFVLGDLMKRKNIVSARLSSLSGSPELNSEIINSIQENAGENISVTKINYSAGNDGTVISLELIASSYEEIPSFIEQLEGTGLFSTTYYTGYTKTSEGYSFILYCYLKAVDSDE